MTKVLKAAISKFFKNLLPNWLEDFFILIGVTIALITTYENFGVVIGNYSLSFILVLFGLLIAKK